MKSALKLMQIDIPGLDQVLGQPVETHGRLKATADGFFLPLCGQKSGTAMSDARDCFFRDRKKPQPLKKLPPTESIDDSIITLTVSTAPVAPQGLLDVVSCSRTAEGKACSGTRCRCNNAALAFLHGLLQVRWRSGLL